MSAMPANPLSANDVPSSEHAVQRLSTSTVRSKVHERNADASCRERDRSARLNTQSSKVQPRVRSPLRSAPVKSHPVNRRFSHHCPDNTASR